MFARKGVLPGPTSFDFPFTPYGIQQELMQNLYSVIENRQIAIFESPTGTGKSLTLTCGSLKWLLDNHECVKAELKKTQLELQERISERTRAESVDWIDTQFETIGLKEELQRLKVVYEYIQKYDRSMMEIRRNVHRMKKQKTSSLAVAKPPRGGDPEETTKEPLGDSDLELNECDSSSGDDDGDVDGLGDAEKSEKPYRPTKIFFCSRTHSQLAQVVNEIKGTKFRDRIRVASLASRQIYCVNEDVRSSGSQSLINERCLDLQKKKSSRAAKVDEDGNVLKKSRTRGQTCGCPFKNPTNVEQLRNEILADVLDIEDLMSVARKGRACPYYASRMAAEDAQIVLLPYQLLFHKATRLQTGVELRDSVVIVDEAHNLMDTIAAIHSAEVTLDQLRMALDQITAYKLKFQSRLKSSNLLKLKQILFLTRQLVRLLEQQPGTMSHRMVLGYELLVEAESFNLDIVQLLRFCDDSRLAQKVHGLAQRNANAPPPPPTTFSAGEGKSLLRQLEDKFSGATGKKNVAPAAVPSKAATAKPFAPQVIRPLLAFLGCLTEKSTDGRVLIECGVKLKYLLLNCGLPFQDILRDCRSIIVAGGTMRPTNELTEQLFAGHAERLREFSFGHVVPADAIRPLVVVKGTSGQRLLFNFANKFDKRLMTDLGQCFVDAVQVVPAGMVAFFASYDYLHAVHEHWRGQGLLAAIQRHKEVFVEPRQSGQATERLLHEYAAAIRRGGGKRGALLLSVVGGKLSEGLNFSDDLGRCVAVVGLPYPNKTAPELVQKMRYLDENLKRGSGSEYYENLCMKAVNQCIGRAVRHIGDFAAILLMDERYAEERVRQKLPEWIRKSLQADSLPCTSMAQQLREFFESRLARIKE